MNEVIVRMVRVVLCFINTLKHTFNWFSGQLKIYKSTCMIEKLELYLV